MFVTAFFAYWRQCPCLGHWALIPLSEEETGQQRQEAEPPFKEFGPPELSMPVSVSPNIQGPTPGLLQSQSHLPKPSPGHHYLLVGQALSWLCIVCMQFPVYNSHDHQSPPTNPAAPTSIRPSSNTFISLKPSLTPLAETVAGSSDLSYFI